MPTFVVHTITGVIFSSFLLSIMYLQSSVHAAELNSLFFSHTRPCHQSVLCYNSFGIHPRDNTSAGFSLDFTCLHSKKLVKVWISLTRFATNVFHLPEWANHAKVMVESVQKYFFDTLTLSAGIIVDIRRDKSNAAHSSNRGIEITFIGVIRDLAHTN